MGVSKVTAGCKSWLGVVKVNVLRCDQGLDEVKVGQCKSVNGTETGV